MKKTFTKKSLAVMLVLVMLVSVSYAVFNSVYAVGERIEIMGAAEIDTVNKCFIFKDEAEQKIGTVTVMINDERQTIVSSNGHDEVVLPGLGNVQLEFIPEEGYEVLGNVSIGGETQYLNEADSNGKRILGMDNTQNTPQIIMISNIVFYEEGNPPQDPNDPGPQDPNDPGPQDPNDPGQQDPNDSGPQASAGLDVRGSSSVNGNYLLFTNAEDETIGKIGVRLNQSEEYLPITTNTINLPSSVIGDGVFIDLIPEEGYEVGNNLFVGSKTEILPGANQNGIKSFYVEFPNANIVTVDNFDFHLIGTGENQEEHQNNPGNGGPVTAEGKYNIVAYFEGINTGVKMNEQDSIIMPDDWTTGKVTFKAKTCTVNGVLAPDNGYNIPDEGSQQEVAVRIEGIANGNQLNNTVVGSKDRTYIEVKQGFEECGKATIHITSIEENGPVNTIINIINKNIMYLTASAPLNMSMSLGSAEVTQAIVTKDVEKNLSIFFGNTEATLTASGYNVDKIIKLNDNGEEVTLNNDGSATIDLPALSKETTTKVKVTILLKDGKSIVRTVNIKRTAILLDYDDRENEIKIGYVMNKAYLYNNKVHDDNIFNAYIQVILYKGNTVAGFKQIKVPDEEIINALVRGTKYKGGNLPEDGSWSIETFSEDAMKIDLNVDSMEGITKVSAFLTNGPISFDSETLPSIEFGIGSGLTVEIGGEE